ncbi:carbon-nitrogen hydrolase family protein [Pseudomonas kuykendallii]|uniref:carbon-nitrogen hydrolase family protein n=1 Tax=Pseudomonas kuykendallii TaxID=1007099 RepID=UPI0028D24B1C|nr:carbon-nitrogen hydrolase family protein [Pseudomonas kuykendallii]
MKVELVQLAGRDGDTAYNLARTLQAIANSAPDTQLLVFPETHLTGFPTADNIAELAEPLDGPSIQAVQRAAGERGVAVVLGIAETDAGQFYNTTLLITPQGIALRYRKTHLWASDRGVFSPGDRYATCEWNGLRIGLLICYDIEFPESARALAQLGAELLVVTNGNMDPYGPVHRTAIMARAMENQAYSVMVNRVGEGDGGLTFAGGSAVVDPFGTLLCEAGRDECRQILELDLDRLQAARGDYRYLDERRMRLPGELIEHADGRRELLIP